MSHEACAKHLEAQMLDSINGDIAKLPVILNPLIHALLTPDVQ